MVIGEIFKKLSDTYYPLDESGDTLELSADQEKADAYGHFRNCIHYVAEYKSSGVMKAVTQLDSTVKQLKDKGKKIDKIFLVLNKIPKFERRLFTVRNEKLYSTNNNRTILIDGMEINTIYRRNLSEFRLRLIIGG